MGSIKNDPAATIDPRCGAIFSRSAAPGSLFSTILGGNSLHLLSAADPDWLPSSPGKSTWDAAPSDVARGWLRSIAFRENCDEDHM
jgi:hypothetical protein